MPFFYFSIFQLLIFLFLSVAFICSFALKSIKPPKLHFIMSQKRVLIAEDSSVIQNLARKILEFQNYEITAVKNGEQVMQIVDKEDFDIVLLDINMPIMDGWQFLDEFRQTRKTKPDEKTIIYLVSSSDSQSDINKAKEYQDQIKDYFFKPMTLEDLQKIF